ncbi:MAG: DUF2231 domain-containing protein [Opitutaceae bacterium]
MKKFILLFGIFVASFATAQAAPINVQCPVTPEEEVAEGIVAVYQGKEIGLCCKSCLRKFNADPEAYIANLPPEVRAQFTATGINEPAERAGHAHGTVHGAVNTASVTTGAEHEAEEQGSHEHNHATDHGADGDSSAWLRKAGLLLGKLHVLSVHLPIGLLTFAAFFELIGFWRATAIWSTVSRFNYVAGALAAVVAAPLGWLAASQANYPTNLQNTLAWHRWLGVSTAVIALAGLLVLFVEHRRAQRTPAVYRIVLAAIALAVPITAHFGGSLIYGPDYLFGGF